MSFCFFGINKLWERICDHPQINGLVKCRIKWEQGQVDVKFLFVVLAVPHSSADSYIARGASLSKGKILSFLDPREKLPWNHKRIFLHTWQELNCVLSDCAFTLLIFLSSSSRSNLPGKWLELFGRLGMQTVRFSGLFSRMHSKFIHQNWLSSRGFWIFGLPYLVTLTS